MRERRPWVFIHVPKSAGTSIRGLLGSDGKHRDAFAPELPGGGRPGTTHLWARHIRDGVGAERWSALFSFAVVRNPWDRFVSLFHYKHRSADRSEFSAWFDRAKDGPTGMFTPQWDRITDGRGAIIVSYVARYEKLDVEWPVICAQIGVHPRPLPHANKAFDRRPYQEYYNGERREYVAGRFAEEIEALRYAF